MHFKIESILNKLKKKKEIIFLYLNKPEISFKVIAVSDLLVPV